MEITSNLNDSQIKDLFQYRNFFIPFLIESSLWQGFLDIGLYIYH